MNIAIIGLGLMGGSLGIALKEAKIAKKVIGFVRTKENLDIALKNKIVDFATLDLAESVKSAEIVFIATPISEIKNTFQKILPFVQKKTIITDLGSTKLKLVNEIEAITPKDIYFIGGHPMAGTEKTGINAAIPNLFINAIWALTVTPKTNQITLKKLTDIIIALKANPLLIAPEIHDRAVAYISHLPYLLACSLVKLIKETDSEQETILNLIASGFKDTTRVSQSSPLWAKDIIENNKDFILEALNGLKTKINQLEKIIKNGKQAEILAEFTQLRDFRKKIK